MLNDREQAGRLLAEKLINYRNSNAIVLAIPRGGIPVGYHIAQKLNLPLDLILSKKIGHPDNSEYAIGAVSLDVSFADRDFGVSEEYIQNEIRRIRALLQFKYQLYMGNHKPVTVSKRPVILTDDGIATGHTMLGAIKILRKSNPSEIIVAVPVAPFHIDAIKTAADLFISLESPLIFSSVGSYYEHFNEVSDEETIQMLNENRM